MKRLLFRIVTLCLLAGGSVVSQAPLGAQTLSVGYAGNNGWNPGVQVGVKLLEEYSPPAFFTCQMGAYWDPDSHVGVYLHAGIGYAMQLSEVSVLEWGVMPVGLYRSWLPQTFEVNDAGEVSVVSLPGNWYFSPSVSVRWARILRLMEGEWYIGIKGMALTPYNTSFLPLLLLEAGVNVPLDGQK